MPTTGHRTYDKVDLDSYRTEEGFNEIFQEGDAVNIDEWLFDHGVDPRSFVNDARKADFVQDESRQQVVEG